MQYLTLEQCIVHNGHRHMRNARRYMRQGNVEFAAGSMRKAARNYVAAKRIALFLEWPRPSRRAMA